MLNDIKSSDSADDKNKNVNNSFIAVKEALLQGDNDSTKNKKDKKSRFTKRQKIIIGAGIAVLILIISGTTYALTHKDKKVAIVETPPAKVEGTPKATEPSRLTGLEVPPENNQRTATGIMIENSPDARPQSGLKDAGVIYEAVAEGGITRFMAVFQDNLPEYVGPVRSVRPYYLDFLGPYDAGIAHVGGSGQALAEIAAQNIKNLDQQISSNSGAYWRESSRYAPHNMYTNVVKLKEIEKQKGWTSTFEGFVRGGEDKASATPNARTINIRMSSANYNVNYQYDAATNTYKRSEGGRPHVDAKSNEQLSPKVVIVPIIPRSQSGIYSVYAVNGTGKVYVFQNGTATEGTWQKTDRKSQFKFTGTDGQPLKLAPGQTWVTIAASADDLTVAP